MHFIRVKADHQLHGCRECKDNYNTIEFGNMGDIFPSHLAHWLANRMNLSCFINCLWDKTPAYNITIALVGSIASKVINEPNRILLGEGTTVNPQNKTRGSYSFSQTLNAGLIRI